jgi:hypothetical protein
MKTIITSVVLIGLILALGQAAGHASGATDQLKRDVYRVCNQSRISSTITEGSCADLQDATNTEFLCAENNTSPNNICWVEVK